MAFVGAPRPGEPGYKEWLAKTRATQKDVFGSEERDITTGPRISLNVSTTSFESVTKGWSVYSQKGPVERGVRYTQKEIPKRQRSKEVLLVPLEQGLAKLQEKPETRYYFEDFKFAALDASKESLNKMGAMLVRYIRTSMKSGDYRPYLSKRNSRYKNYIIAKKFRDIVGTPSLVRNPQPTIKAWKGISSLKTFRQVEGKKGSHGYYDRSGKFVSFSGETKNQLRGRWLKLARPEAYQYNPAGTIYHAGSYKRRFGDVLGKLPVVKRLKQGGQGLIHWSSQPYTPPAPDTEMLRDCLEYDVEQLSQSIYRLSISAFTPGNYARILEFGSAKAGIAPRPFMRPAIEKYREKFKEEYAKAFRSKLGTVGRISKGIAKDIDKGHKGWDVSGKARERASGPRNPVIVGREMDLEAMKQRSYSGKYWKF